MLLFQKKDILIKIIVGTLLNAFEYEKNCLNIWTEFLLWWEEYLQYEMLSSISSDRD